MSGRSPTTNRVLEGLSRVRAARVDDSGDVQVLQVEAHGEPIPGVQHLLPYGLAVGLPKKATGLMGLVGGAWDHLVAWGFALARHRPKDLGEGDVTLYSGHDARLDLRGAGATVRGPKLDAPDGYVHAKGGFRADNAPGLSGTLTIVVTTGGAATTLLVETLKGGIVTARETGGVAPIANGSTISATWVEA